MATNKRGRKTKDALASITWTVDDETGCWSVDGPTTPGGYKTICRIINGSKVTLYAHRVIYERHNNVKLEAGQIVCHTCDNPRCVNPEHLWVGTDGDNMRDCVLKGRSVALLTPAQAEYIILRSEWHAGDAHKLAAALGVSYQSVADCRMGKTWGHLRTLLLGDFADGWKPKVYEKTLVSMLDVEERKKAKSMERTRYFGMPCAHGHGTLRHTSTGTCVVCVKERQAHVRPAKKEAPNE